ncbi:hypothetical protein [Ramlibacter sp. WS9]|uniref:hypothetical protein n=1 Tax=Ramlibacter sp. WS9 TaxID=1882741 RepID=UPI001142DD3C|nr:hypothetical protein [Ramlibacter sp. WS9]ROZ71318.1 hypothetical protein EEB15_22025 [Ramlibacter sp. WS9]
MTAPKSAGQIKPLWSTGGFHNPECGIVDHRVGQIYLSCMASDSSVAAAGRGYISRLSLSGEVLEKQWIGGLKVPCGITVRESRLFVVDCDRLLVFDTRSARQVAEYPAPGAVFLDGMAVDETGDNVFVSDIAGNAIWKLEGNEWGCWLSSPLLDFPDGMIAEPHRLVVGTHGIWKGVRQFRPGATPDHKGHLIAIDYESKEITDIGAGSPIAHHDGLTTDGADGYITSDFVYNCLIHVTNSGAVTPLLRFDAMDDNLAPAVRTEYCELAAEHGRSGGPADIRYDAKTGLLLVPFVDAGKLSAFSYVR